MNLCVPQVLVSLSADLLTRNTPNVNRSAQLITNLSRVRVSGDDLLCVTHRRWDTLCAHFAEARAVLWAHCAKNKRRSCWHQSWREKTLPLRCAKHTKRLRWGLTSEGACPLYSPPGDQLLHCEHSWDFHLPGITPGRDHLLPNQLGPAAAAAAQLESHDEDQCQSSSASYIKRSEALLHLSLQFGTTLFLTLKGQVWTCWPLAERVIHCQLTLNSAHWGNHLLQNLSPGTQRQFSETSVPLF